MSTFFTYGKPAVINGCRKSPSWLLIFLVFSFNKIALCSRNLIAFIISFISFVVSVIPKPMNVSTVFNNLFAEFIKAPKSERVSKPPNYIILNNWGFGNLKVADEQLTRGLQIFETCVSVNNNLCGKLILLLESPTTFYEGFKVISVPFFIADFNFLSFELDNLIMLYCYYIKTI